MDDWGGVRRFPRFRIGITSRLLAGFVGVGALVLAANFLVEQSVLVEKTTEITRTVARDVPAPPLAARPAAAPAAAPAVLSAPSRSVGNDALTTSISRFGRAVQSRADNHSAQADSEAERSARELDRVLSDYLVAARGLSPSADLKHIAANVNAYEALGSDLVLTADDRRSLIEDYAQLIEASSERVKHSLDRAWKIFGRVVARQSLLRSSADLDTLRQSAAALGKEEDILPPMLATLEANENTLAKTLDGNQKQFRRSEGDAWFDAMHEDVVKLAETRTLLVQASLRLQEGAEHVGEETERLTRMIPRKVESRPQAAPVRPQSSANSNALRADTAPAVAHGAEHDAPRVRTQSITTPLPGPARQHLLAWISWGAVLLSIGVCLSTILSVVRPVRRLLAATVRIANGEDAVRVMRGGVKELDTLALSFNTMADELTKAKAASLRAHQSLEAKVAERTRQLQDLAERDPLTGLPNRRQLFDLLNAAIDSAAANGHMAAVFFLDIDNFKFINDSLGHAFGDRVLLTLATRLQQAASAHGFAARLGGDEFTVILEKATTLEEIRLVGLNVVSAFQQPLSVDGRDLIVSVSVGASIFPDHETDAQALLQAADAALFRAKKLGRSQLSVFTPDLLETAAANFTTEQGLRRAIERGEFELVFQPEISVETLETSLVEALIRWRMPDGSLVAPGQFLAVAEESGLIIEISDWVLKSAIEAAAHWHHGAWPQARVAINVSPRQLFDHHFVDRLQDLLEQYQLPARCIEIELTESVLQTGPATIEALRRLHAKGVAIALDDFGTGYSSLASLEQLPLNRIKLDRSLIAGIDRNARSAAITHAMIAMCQGLGLEITAEGVERPEQFGLLLGHRAMYLQGYLISPPVLRNELVPLLPRLAARAQELLLTWQETAPTGNAASGSVGSRRQPRERLPERAVLEAQGS